eukprot:TRINITY_DN20291_c0_g1_i4.p1 TRINITY_DN20291_c0_g1~~TRINITY_DN20291_c0_g1_i4.p1  ORF type:complete len:659 (-),score=44.27 TRINITY_DN20291_c0_g1_i4:519-2495(-)
MLSIILMAFLTRVRSIEVYKSEVPYFIIEQSHLEIVQPPSLAGVYNVSLSNFGIPSYGAILTGKAVVLQDNDGCNEFQIPSKASNIELPSIVFIDRGGCAFVDKVYNAQQAGAVAAILMNYRSGIAPTMTIPQGPEYEQIAQNITIPNGMIDKVLADVIKLRSQYGDDIIVKLDWTDSIAYPDDRVEWEFWFSSDPSCGGVCDETSDFLIDIAPTVEQLEKENHVEFKPHTVFRKCYTGYDCSECIKGGRYCAYQASTEAKQVAWQNLRHICVHQEAQNLGESYRWWTYITYFQKHCSQNFTEACANDAISSAGMFGPQIVDMCMGEIDADEIIDLVEETIEEMRDGSNTGRGTILLVPTVVINMDQYRGTLTSNSVLKAICSGFQETTEPEVCLSSSLQQNECMDFDSVCSGNATCIDTFRGYQCKCNQGYQGDGFTCMDIDECAQQNTPNALCDQVCVNLPGSYRCECLDGYQMHVNNICTPINLCEYNNGGCEGTCTMLVPGKRTCECGPGLIVDTDGMTCRDINECLQDTNTCQQICVNLDPRSSTTNNMQYRCECYEGYELDKQENGKCVQMSISKLSGTQQSSSNAAVIVVPIVCVFVFVIIALLTMYVMFTRERRLRRLITLDAIDITQNLLSKEVEQGGDRTEPQEQSAM